MQLHHNANSAYSRFITLYYNNFKPHILWPQHFYLIINGVFFNLTPDNLALTDPMKIQDDPPPIRYSKYKILQLA